MKTLTPLSGPGLALVLHDTVGIEELNRCIERRILRWKLPEDGKDYAVSPSPTPSRWISNRRTGQTRIQSAVGRSRWGYQPDRSCGAAV